MKIVHLCVNGPFTEGWGYQENLLSKYHALAGHEVTVIAGQEKHQPSGEIVQAPVGETMLEDGVRLIRVAASQSGLRVWRKLFSRHDVLALLRRLQPDLVMIHGMVGDVSALQVKRYVCKESPNTRVVNDIHQDIYNTFFPKNPLKKSIASALHRFMNGRMYPLYQRIYYVAPSSRDMAEEYYAAPEEKLSFLPLGCDTAAIEAIDRVAARKAVREELGFEPDDILLIHGGKLNDEKRTAELIQAMKTLHQKNSHVKLIVFGAAVPSYQRTIAEALPGTEGFVCLLGHQQRSAYYRLLMASDIAVFPGSQSALWQQAASCGLALVIRLLAGGEYLDVGGNARFLMEGSAREIGATLDELIESGAYKNMKTTSEEKAMPFFSYRMIAQRVIDEATA